MFWSYNPIFCNNDRKSIPLGSFTCVLRTQFKEVSDVEWLISVGMNDVKYDVLERTKDIRSCFQCKQMGTYVDNLMKRFKAFRVLVENLPWTCFFFPSGRVKGVISYKTTSNNLIFHSHHEFKGNQWEKERDYYKKNLFQVRAHFGMRRSVHAFSCNIYMYYPLYKINWYITMLYF